MLDIIIDPKVPFKSKVHPTIIEQIRKKMLRDSAPTRPKAKRKWREIVYLSAGPRYAVDCQKEEDDKIVIIGVQQLKRGKPVGPPKRK